MSASEQLNKLLGINHSTKSTSDTSSTNTNRLDSTIKPFNAQQQQQQPPPPPQPQQQTQPTRSSQPQRKSRPSDAERQREFFQADDIESLFFDNTQQQQSNRNNHNHKQNQLQQPEKPQRPRLDSFTQQDNNLNQFINSEVDQKSERPSAIYGAPSYNHNNNHNTNNNNNNHTISENFFPAVQHTEMNLKTRASFQRNRSQNHNNRNPLSSTIKRNQLKNSENRDKAHMQSHQLYNNNNTNNNNNNNNNNTHNSNNNNFTTTKNFGLKKEDVEPKASRLSDENGKSLFMHRGKYFYASGFKGIFYLAGSAPHSAIAMLPYFFSEFGILFAIILILCTTFISNCTFFYLLKAKNLSLRSNYHTIAEFLSGKHGTRLVFFIQFVTKFFNSTLLVYFAVKHLQQFIVNILSDQSLDESSLPFFESLAFFTAVVFTAFLFLAFFVVGIESSYFLCIFNIIFLLAIAILTFLSFIATITTHEELKGDYVFAPTDFQFGYALRSVSLLFFILDIHVNFFTVFKQIRFVTDKKMLRTSLYANMILGVFYILIGSFGYITMTELNRTADYFLIPTDLNPHQLTISQVSLVFSTFYCFLNFPISFAATKHNLFKLSKILLTKGSSQSLLISETHSEHAIKQISNHIHNNHNNINNHSNQNNLLTNPNGLFLSDLHTPHDNHSSHIPQRASSSGLFYHNHLVDPLLKTEVHPEVDRFNKFKNHLATLLLMVVMSTVNYFLNDPLIMIFVVGVFFSAAYSFVMPIAFYIRLSQYDSTSVVITSILLLFVVIGLDIVTLFGHAFTFIE